MKMAGRKGGTDSGSHDHNEIEKFENYLEDQQLEELYSWVDNIPLSRPKKNIARDFSDGVMCAELLLHYFPDDDLVHMHNYTACCSTNKKKENWYFLNRKVFRKLNFELAEDLINDLVGCKPGVIEKVLLMLKSKIDRAMYAKERMEKPESEQHEVSPGRKGGSIKVGTDPKAGKMVKKQGRESLGLTDKGSSKAPAIDNKNVKPAVRVQAAPSKGPQAQGQGVPKKRVGNMAETDLVPRYVVEEKEQEVLSRDETIQILQAKISRLEHLLHLKDIRIEDLQNRVEASRPTGLRNDVTNRQQRKQ